MRTVTIVLRDRLGGKRQAGFSMIDLVITVLIIGILAAVATPKFVDTLHRMQADAAAQRIRTDLGYARQTAISQSATLLVSFSPTTNQYSIARLADIDRLGAAYMVDLAASPYNATLREAALDADADIQFDRYGKPDSGGVITVESGGYQQTVTIHPDTGKASIP